MNRAPLATLPQAQRRLVEIDRERNAARDSAARSSALHGTFAALARARSPREILDELLEAAQRVLHFERSGYFAHDQAGNACRGDLRLVAYRDAAALDRPPDLDCSPEACALRHAATGNGEELGAPVVDVRRWYVLAPILGRSRRLGVLYLDGPRQGVPDGALLEFVDALCAVASAALENAYEVRRTRSLATRDPLTGLLNRRAFRARLERELATSKRTGGRCACVMLDLDDLKRVNDAGGHALGDERLKGVAATLAANARTGDLVARLGGDEFAVVFSGVDAALARELLRRLSVALAGAGLRCSLGAVLSSEERAGVDDLLRAADAVLYRVKASGKNGYAFAP